MTTFREAVIRCEELQKKGLPPEHSDVTVIIAYAQEMKQFARTEASKRANMASRLAEYETQEPEEEEPERVLDYEALEDVYGKTRDTIRELLDGDDNLIHYFAGRLGTQPDIDEIVEQHGRSGVIAVSTGDIETTKIVWIPFEGNEHIFGIEAFDAVLERSGLSVEDVLGLRAKL